MEPAAPSTRRFADQARAVAIWHKTAYGLVAVFLLGIFALLAVAIPSVINEFEHGFPVYSLRPPSTPLAATHTRLHLGLIALDEWQGTATLRVSGSHACPAGCTWSDRIVFVAAQQTQQGVEGLPASASVTLPPSDSEVTQTITLPIDGRPLFYPFDTYRLTLGVLVERVAANGTVQILSPAEARGELVLSLQSHIPETVIGRPTLLPAQAMPIVDSPVNYALVVDVHLARPRYSQILAVLLVLLVAAAAAYAVFLRPLADLIINAGALVLGVWGVRAILAGTAKPGSTALDLALSIVILFLLGGVTGRMLSYLDHRSGARLLQRTGLRLSAPAAGASRPTEHTDAEASGAHSGPEPARTATAKLDTQTRRLARPRRRRPEQKRSRPPTTDPAEQR